MSRKSINSDATEVSTENGQTMQLPISLSPTVEFLLLFGLTLLAALSLAIVF